MYVYLLHVIPNFRLLPIHNTTFQTTPNTQYYISDYSQYTIPYFRLLPIRNTKFQTRTIPNTSYQISDYSQHQLPNFRRFQIRNNNFRTGICGSCLVTQVCSAFSQSIQLRFQTSRPYLPQNDKRTSRTYLYMAG